MYILMFETSHYRTLAHSRNQVLMIWYSLLISGNKGLILTFQNTGMKTAIYCGVSAAVSVFESQISFGPSVSLDSTYFRQVEVYIISAISPYL